MKTLTLVLDNDDDRAVQAAIAERQRDSRWPDGGVMLPEGKSNLSGAIIAEICRAYVDYRALYQPPEAVA